MFRNFFVICMLLFLQFFSGFDWSEESKIEGKIQNNKREYEDDDESSDSEMEVSEQVMCVQVNCVYDQCSVV